MTPGPDHPARVLVAGGGIAGIEAALALREIAGPAARVTVVDPGRRFAIPATATGRAFGLGTAVDLRLADVVSRAGADLVGGRLAAVDASRRMATLDGGRLVPYDALIVAVGAVPVPVVDGALTFSGAGDIVAVRALIDDVARRAGRGAPVSLVFVVPQGCGWPLAAYELALMSREHLSQVADPRGLVEITVVTPEDAPLGVFGATASDAVGATLARARVAIRTRAVVRGWDAGRLDLADSPSMMADRVVALPLLRGPHLAGLPCDEDGFIRVGDDGRVPGTPDVWAVGDGTTSPVKQGGLACRQADEAAASVARRLGLAATKERRAAALSGWLWDGRRGRSLPSGAPVPDVDRGEAPALWPVAKIGGRYLAPFLRTLLDGDISATGCIGVPS